MDWQPIETAPKDGTEIDLWVIEQNGHGYRRIEASWDEHTVYDCYPVRSHKEVGWSFYEMIDGMGMRSPVEEQGNRVTHWMPQPCGPSDSDTRPKDGDAKQGSTRE